MALRVGPRGLHLKVVAAYGGLCCLYGRRGLPVGLLFGGAEDVGLCEAACGVSRSETDPSADLGGSSKYSNENFED